MFDYPPTAVLNLIKTLLERIEFARELSKAASVRIELLVLYDQVEAETLTLENILIQSRYSTEYANALAKALDKLISAFPRFYGNGERKPITLQATEISIHKQQQERDQPAIEGALSAFRIVVDFFVKLDFFNNHLVIVGANGSGKTFLANNIKNHIKQNGVVISAQRILSLPEFISVKGHSIISDDLKSVQAADKTNKSIDLRLMQQEFGILIEYLLSDNIETERSYKQSALEKSKLGLAIEPPLPSKLDSILRIWNSVFRFPQIVQDGINIKVVNNELSYSVAELSEGEKVVLFLLAQIISAPRKGFAIIDEPEIFLHPSIHRRLWDQLESERDDLTFIYITHDLEFATSRVRAKKLWLKSFRYPDKFNLEEIPKNEIPQTLLLELLGSKRDILFCEGKEESLDQQIYSILFPQFTIKPVGGCSSVINYTKAFNKIDSALTKAKGLIDRDFHSQRRLELLESDYVYGIKVAEVENLLLDEDILNQLRIELGLEITKVKEIKDEVIKKLTRDRMLQISKFVSAKVDQYFKDSNVPMAKDLVTLSANYDQFLKGVEIDSWAMERGAHIDEIILKDDYEGAIRIIKDKGLEALVNKIFGIHEYNLIAIGLLQKHSNLKSKIHSYLPNLQPEHYKDLANRKSKIETR